METLATKIQSAQFYEARHSTIFKAMIELFTRGEPVDIVTLSAELENANALNHTGGRSYLAELESAVPTASHVEFYADIVIDKWRQRRMIEVGREIVQLGQSPGEDGVDDAVAKAQELSFALSSYESTTDFEKLGDRQVGQFFARLDAIEDGSQPRGLATGIHEVDRIAGGFLPQELIVIAARPAMGKTSGILNIALHNAKQNIPVGILSLEMSKEELTDRLMAQYAHVDGNKLKKPGLLSPAERKKLETHADPFHKLPIYVDDSSFVNDLSLIAKARRLHSLTNSRMLLVDYLQLMEGSAKHKSTNREQEVSAISRALKNIAKELRIVILAASQLSRAVEQRPNKRPILSDLRESGSIEQEADKVIFIYRDGYYNPSANQKEGEWNVAKNRNGLTGTARVAWIPELTLFADLYKGSRE